MKNARTVALIAGFAFITLAIFIQALVPAAMKVTNTKEVTMTIRTSLGELKEVRGKAKPYGNLLAKGRVIYLREGCWYCHSMYVRPIAGEDRRWGPISQAGEYAYDIPHTFGTRRIGPDLTREGGKFGDDWHRVHFFDARIIVPESIMPRFTWFYEKREGEDVLNQDGRAIVAFVQNLGMNRGKWRDDFAYQLVRSGESTIPGRGLVEHGKKVYKGRCQGCHSEKGDGDGPAAGFFKKVLPRDFTSGVFKFRSTPSGSLPLDSDIYRTITIGVRGTAMPAWFTLSEKDRLDVVKYVKTFSNLFQTEKPRQPVYVPGAPDPDRDLLAQGSDLYDMLQCAQCHGEEGKGNGESADYLTDDWGDKILPTDFTKGIFKVGPRPEDMYRTFMTGLNGTPMPSYAPILAKEKDRWSLSYFVLSFSADSPAERNREGGREAKESGSNGQDAGEEQKWAER